MITKLIEVTTAPRFPGDQMKNWGKFMVARFDQEWRHKSRVADVATNLPLLVHCGWGLSDRTIFVTDLQTGEGAIFSHGGYAPADLDKHMIWVCPLFEPFLAWLYKQDISDLTKLPDLVELPGEFSFSGYRRGGPTGDGHPEYFDPTFPERACDCCETLYSGPAVYCSFTCAVKDR